MDSELIIASADEMPSWCIRISIELGEESHDENTDNDGHKK